MGLTFQDVGGLNCGTNFCGCTVGATGTLTSTIFGAFAMTLVGSRNFTGSKSYAYPGQAAMLSAGTITLDVIVSCVSGVWKLDIVVAQLPFASTCPGPGTPTGHLGLFTAASANCSPTSSGTLRRGHLHDWRRLSPI